MSSLSEDGIVEQPLMDILSQELNWEVADVYDGEKFGPSGTIGRDSQEDVLLKHRFLYTVKTLNPNLPDIAYDKAFEEINSNDITKNMEDLNHVKYDYLTNGLGTLELCKFKVILSELFIFINFKFLSVGS